MILCRAGDPRATTILRSLGVVQQLFARPSSTDTSKTLASATSLTLLVPPPIEFGDDLFFLKSAFAELARDLRTQCSEQLTFVSIGRLASGRRQKWKSRLARFESAR